MVAALALAACEAPAPLTSAEDDGRGRQFTPPTNGEAALYLFGRGGGQFSITANRLQIGDVSAAYWIRTDLPPGRYDIRCGAPAYSLSPGDLLVQLSPGDVKYVATRISLGTGSCRLAEEPAATAQPAILAGKRVRELR